jgi:hypothetical protein
MCDVCVDLDASIARYQRFLPQALDPLTAERLSGAVEEMTSRKASLHPAERPHCLKCLAPMKRIPALLGAIFACEMCGSDEPLTDGVALC